MLPLLKIEPNLVATQNAISYEIVYLLIKLCHNGQYYLYSNIVWHAKCNGILKK